MTEIELRVSDCISGMRCIDGDAFRVSSGRHYPEETPAHCVAVSGFWVDTTSAMPRHHPCGSKSNINGLGNHPVVHVAYADAIALFCRIGKVARIHTRQINCRRYRPTARHAEPIGTSTSHVGFRCVVREDRRS